jgi:peptidoglycan/LPS O-acetylase OafA/YrhL
MHANSLVAVAHPAPVDALTLARFGLWTGVNVFFALSGYLITRPYVRALLAGDALPDLRAFLVRRAARILPAYWLALLALDLVSRPATGGGPALSHVLLLQDLVPGETRTVFPIAWSLGIEALFYASVPLVAAAIRTRHPGALPARTLLHGVAATWVASALACVAGYVFLAGAEARWQDMLHVSLPAMLFLFCPGIAVGIAESEVARNPQALPHYRAACARGSLLAAVAATMWLLALVGLDRHSVAGSVAQDQLLTLACGLAVVAALHPGPRLDRAAAWLAPVGTVSYGIYLWHWVVAVAWARWLGPIRLDAGTGHLAWLAAALLLAAAAVALGTASWVLVERPAMRRAAAVARRLAPRAEASAAQQRQPHGAPRVVAIHVHNHEALPGAQLHASAAHGNGQRG